MKPAIYLLPIDAVNSFLKEKTGNDETSPEDVKTLSRADCGTVLFLHEKEHGHDTPAGLYCPQVFQEQFNNALDRDEITSKDYYVRIFA